jgi:serine/threonine-protein kinase
MAELVAQALEGTMLGRYRLKYRLAEGGMATVYLGQLEGAHRFERWVAMKVVHPEHAADTRFVEMLLDEARTAAKLHHPNICSVLDFGEQNGLVYLVMEYLEGETLSAVVRRGWAEEKGMPYWLAARTVVDAARGLHYAHELTDPHGDSYDIVHRDVSPQNLVVLYEGVTKVVDFGIARARGRLSTTRVDEVKGKLTYLAPEQLLKESVDRRADVWALGVVLWESTVGHRLFRGQSTTDTAKNVVGMSIPLPSQVRPGYPPKLEQIVMRALDRDLARRTPSANQLADELEEFLYTGGRPAGPAQVAQHMRREFDDRFAVRRALLGEDDSEEIVTVRDLQSESTFGSHLFQAARAERSGARLAPAGPASPASPADRATLRPVGLPSKKGDSVEIELDEMSAGADEAVSVGPDPSEPTIPRGKPTVRGDPTAIIDREIRDLKSQRKSRALVVGAVVLGLVLLGVAIAMGMGGAFAP